MTPRVWDIWWNIGRLYALSRTFSDGYTALRAFRKTFGYPEASEQLIEQVRLHLHLTKGDE